MVIIYCKTTFRDIVYQQWNCFLYAAQRLPHASEGKIQNMRRLFPRGMLRGLCTRAKPENFHAEEFVCYECRFVNRTAALDQVYHIANIVWCKWAGALGPAVIFQKSAWARLPGVNQKQKHQCRQGSRLVCSLGVNDKDCAKKKGTRARGLKPVCRRCECSSRQKAAHGIP